jgi:peptide/nickel transport system permease protein
MRFLRQLNPEARWGLGILVVIVVLGSLVPTVSPYSALTSSGTPLLKPGLTHLFGTDNLGRDVFARVFAAAQVDIFLSFTGVSVPLLIGTLIGGVLGTSRSTGLSVIWMMVIDGINAFPFIVLVIAIVAIVGPGVLGVLVALSLTNWARYAKIARTRALVLREADFVHATRVLGYSAPRVLLNHILPNVYTETLAYGLSDFVLVIITVAGLSFLGFGVRPPNPEWGGMMADGRLFLQRAWWIAVFPGIALSMTAIGVTLLAQGVVGRIRGDE